MNPKLKERRTVEPTDKGHYRANDYFCPLQRSRPYLRGQIQYWHGVETSVLCRECRRVPYQRFHCTLEVWTGLTGDGGTHNLTEVTTTQPHHQSCQRHLQLELSLTLWYLLFHPLT